MTKIFKMRYGIFLFAFLTLVHVAASQDSIRQRVIILGTGAKLSDNDQNKIKEAVNNVIRGKTTVLILDENKWLIGKHDRRDRKGYTTSLESLLTSFKTFRERGAAVFFTSGNNEWNAVTGNPSKFSEKAALDSLPKIIPGNQCPDPVEVNLANDMSIILFNTRYWLDAAVEEVPGSDCAYGSKAAILARLDELRYKHRDKFVFFVSYHPIESYGVLGSRSSLKDHVFPLTGLQKNLYVPLPVAGSVYRFFRSAFAGPGNSKHPLYKDMQRGVKDIFSQYPNLVYIGGREPGLQLLEDDNLFVVAGDDAGNSIRRKGKHSLFSTAGNGYIVADLLVDSTIRFKFYEEKIKEPLFSQSLSFIPLVEHDTITNGQSLPDTVVVQAHASYDSVGKLRRIFFGENYRKEWAAPTSLPVIRISKYKGGLTPVQRGGGMQSKSLRLIDKDSTEWVIRSVEKSPDALLPENFRRTFARDWVDDATSAQHPYAALVVPPIANAVKVPHASPVIGVIAPDRNLGIHGRVFSNMIALVEEREPLGDSDNSEKMKRNLKKDNDNRLLGKQFLNARMLDMLLGDWDRHEDQWRWKDQRKGKKKTYLGIPRDRDQVFHLTKGIVPKIASRDYILPTLRNFDKGIRHEKWVIYKTKFVNAYPDFQLSRDQWQEQALQFQKAVTDSVLEAGLKRLPKSAYDIRHDELLEVLKARRDRLPGAMDAYYRFTQKIVDIQATDKNEWVQINDAPNGGMRIKIAKLSRSGKIEDELMDKVYDAKLTKEIRLYLGDGSDSVVVKNSGSPIRLRLIGGNDAKSYTVNEAKNRVRLYDRHNQSRFYGRKEKIAAHLSDDSLHTAFVPVNLYNIWQPITVVGLNLDDGFILGAGFKLTRQEGFRKVPSSNTQQLVAAYSFSTGAYRIRYAGEWRRIFPKTDLIVQALARAPNNTMNFFGRGNSTVYDKTGDHKRFYRTRYSTYLFEPALKWGSNGSTVFTAGPSMYYYAFDKDENKGRFIEQTGKIGSYDSLTIEQSKLHAGLALQLTNDRRNSRVFPQWGSFLNIRLQAYKGLSGQTRSFAQLIPEIAVYKSLTRRSTIVLAERLGGIIGFGEAAFYQSAYLGGHENLFGYRQYRFAGRHSLYNNLELRIKLADIVSYILPGQFGIVGFWDTGRVWERHDNSDKWHNGVGGGIYFAPASVIALSFVAGHSSEGWYPYFTLGMRF
jgi:hypothetical protein